MADEDDSKDDLNAYERYVLTCFTAGDISWMPLGKALTMPGLRGLGSSHEEKGDESDSSDIKMAKMQEQMDEMKMQMAEMLALLKKNVA